MTNSIVGYHTLGATIRNFIGPKSVPIGVCSCLSRRTELAVRDGTICTYNRIVARINVVARAEASRVR